MSRLGKLSVSIAYPGTLGGPIPDPPPGHAWLTDDNGVILTDDKGVKIAVPVGYTPPPLWPA